MFTAIGISLIVVGLLIVIGDCHSRYVKAVSMSGNDRWFTHVNHLRSLAFWAGTLMIVVGIVVLCNTYQLA